MATGCELRSYMFINDWFMLICMLWFLPICRGNKVWIIYNQSSWKDQHGEEAPCCRELVTLLGRRVDFGLSQSASKNQLSAAAGGCWFITWTLHGDTRWTGGTGRNWPFVPAGARNSKWFMLRWQCFNKWRRICQVRALGLGEIWKITDTRFFRFIFSDLSHLSALSPRCCQPACRTGHYR